MKDKREFLRNPNSGFFQDVVLRFKLILKLMGDRRVNFFIKLLPVGAIIYLISPLDFLPGAVLPFIGALDDAAVLWLGVTLFVSLCPEDVVREHMEVLNNVVAGSWYDAEEVPENKEVIDVEVNDISEKQTQRHAQP
jgi:uncharacterized membrane protein YkvA (DUF1232 family)